jgi:hypothetical protein
MENTKEQVVAEWKAVNEPRLKEIKSANPDLYSAINLALNYLNKKLGGDELPVEVDELPFKVGDVFRRNMVGEEPPNTEITYTITEIKDNKIGVYVQFFAGNKNQPRNVFKKIEDVLEEIETGGWVLYEGQTSETKQWTLDDFKYSKIIVDTPEKSKRFQELVLSLGAEWVDYDVEDESKKKLVNNTDEKYLALNNYGALYFLSQESWEDSDKEERIYEEIFSNVSETEQVQLSDFYNTKIYFDTQDKSKKFQELIFSLGGLWSNGNKKVLDYKYIFVDDEGILSKTESSSYFTQDSNNEIFYDDIFQNVSETTTWRFKTREELDAEGISVTLGIPESEFNTYLGKSFSEIYSKERFKNLDEAVQSLENNNIYLGKAQWSSHIDYFTKNPLPTQSAANPETYPAQSELTYTYSFTPNKGDRKSPTQSAGELKKIAEKHSTSAVQIELLSTKFKGNDGNWYSINIGKTGTWTWKETTPPPAQPQTTTSTASSQPAPTTTTKKEWKPEDLVGKKLNWSGREYEVIKFKRNNPKYKSYTLRTQQGTELEGKLTIGAINKLLNDEFVKGITIVKPVQTSTPENDFQLQLSKMTKNKLYALYSETLDAKQEFNEDDDEYNELTIQLVDIEKEINNRK